MKQYHIDRRCIIRQAAIDKCDRRLIDAASSHRGRPGTARITRATMLALIIAIEEAYFHEALKDIRDWETAYCPGKLDWGAKFRSKRSILKIIKPSADVAPA